jgi:flagellar assembly factor FliW
MLINTMDFGCVEIFEDDIINFPKGVYGFKDSKSFVLLKNPENRWMMHLQSVDDIKPRFILLDPFLFINDYKPILPQEADEIFNTNNIEELSIFTIAVIPSNVRDMTINLKSPIVIDFKRKIGAQVILENKDYEVRTRLFHAEVG